VSPPEFGFDSSISPYTLVATVNRSRIVLGEHVAEDRLALAVRVDVRGVEERDTQIDRALDQLPTLLLVEHPLVFAPEAHAAEGESADGRARIPASCAPYGSGNLGA